MTLQLFVLDLNTAPLTHADPILCAVSWTVRDGVGEAQFHDHAAPMPAPSGEGAYCFGLAQVAPKAASGVWPVDPPGERFLLRLDTVTFPPGAVAWRHVHEGAGIRLLTTGRLRITGDEHSAVMSPGDHWFEPAHTPVKATPEAGQSPTMFVRAMLVPLEYEGKPTIQILDPADAAKPRLQITERHIDQIVTLPQSG